MNAHAVWLIEAFLMPGAFPVGFYGGRAAWTRYVLVPRMFRERYPDYQVVTREEAERERLTLEEERKARLAVTSEAQNLQAQMQMMQNELNNMKDAQNKSTKLAAKQPGGERLVKGVASEYDGDFGGKSNTLGLWPAAVSYRPDVIKSLMDERIATWTTREDFRTQREEYMEWIGDRALSKSEQKVLAELNLEIERLDKRIGDLDLRIKKVEEEAVRVKVFQDKARKFRTGKCARPDCDLNAGTSGYCKGHTSRTEVHTWGGELVHTLQDTWNQLGGYQEIPTDQDGNLPLPIHMSEMRLVGVLDKIEDLPDNLTPVDRGQYWTIGDTQYVCVQPNLGPLYLHQSKPSQILTSPNEQFDADATTNALVSRFLAQGASEDPGTAYTKSLLQDIANISTLMLTPPAQTEPWTPEPNPPGAWKARINFGDPLRCIGDIQ